METAKQAQPHSRRTGLTRCEQLASLYADAGDSAQLDATVEELRRIAGDRAATHYFAAVAAFLRGRAAKASALAERAVAIDPGYAPVYDLLGAAYTKLGQAGPGAGGVSEVAVLRCT